MKIFSRTKLILLAALPYMAYFSVAPLAQAQEVLAPVFSEESSTQETSQRRIERVNRRIARLSERTTRSLELSPQQKEAVAEILSAYGPEYDAAEDEVIQASIALELAINKETYEQKALDMALSDYNSAIEKFVVIKAKRNQEILTVLDADQENELRNYFDKMVRRYKTLKSLARQLWQAFIARHT